MSRYTPRNRSARRMGFESLEARVVMSAQSPLAAVASAVVDDQAGAPAAVTLPVEQWVASLNYTQFALVEPQYVPLLSTQQIASIPNSYFLGLMSDSARAALTPVQIQALNTASVRITPLTSTQISWLTTPQVRALSPLDLPYVTAGQVPQLTTGQIASIVDTGALAQWTPEARAALTPAQVQALNVGNIRITLLTPTQIGWLTTAQIQSLPYFDFPLLSAAQVPALTGAQVASIPTTGALAQWSAGARAALTATQVKSLNVAEVRITLLTSDQVAALTTAQVQSLPNYDLPFLNPWQTPLLTAAQIATVVDTGAFAEWSAAARAALTQSQVQALRVANIRITLLTSAQIAWLTTAQIQSLPHYDFPFLNPAQIPALSLAQVSSIPDTGALGQWSAAARAALTQSQIPQLQITKIRLSLLTSAQAGWLTTLQVQSLAQYDFAYLNAWQVPLLTSAQIASIPSTGALAQWSAANRAALTAAQVQSLNVAAVRITLLTPTQIAALRRAQLQSLALDDLPYLNANQIPLLMPSQVSAAAATGQIYSWTAAARAALIAPQVQTLNVGSMGIGFLTNVQVSWLSVPQIQSLKNYEITRLAVSQIPYLSASQIATIIDTVAFAAWTSEARAALTPLQVAALRVANIRITLLTPTQVGWLTAAQIQSLPQYDFPYLHPWQIGSLSIAQVAAIPTTGALSQWSAAARASLTAAQVQSLNVANVSISLLTSAQVAALTPTQIRSLGLYEFGYLSPAQIPQLSATQMASIPNSGYFTTWTAQQRAALTVAQVRSLNVAAVWINRLTPEQIGWLTTAQVQAVRYEDFELLLPWQIPLLTPAQFSTIPTFAILASMPDEVQAKFTREQLLALKPEVFAVYTHLPVPTTPPSGYTPIVDLSRDADGLLTSDHLTHEAAAVFNLVPLEAATHVTIASGAWSNPAVWRNGLVPTAGAKVVISAGTAVQVDRVLTPALKTVRVDGMLWFATHVNTQLVVDTMVVHTNGQLHIGTAANPIAAHVTAQIVIPDSGPIDMHWDPTLISRGLISRGEVRMQGAAVTPYAALSTAPLAGATQLVLAQPPVNWRVGDKLVLTGANPYAAGANTEELVIRAISGTTVTVDPLRYSHVPPTGFGLSMYVANMTRNVIFRAADASVVSERPHMMFMHNPDVQVTGISVTGFGRTDKTKAIVSPPAHHADHTVVLNPSDYNPRARYAIHFHHTGVEPSVAAAVLTGSVVTGSPGWGYVNHSSNVALVDNIAYQVVGSSFAAEDGNEIGLMQGNLSIGNSGSGHHIQAREGNHDWGHGGHGFWLQGPGVEVVKNIAVDSADAAFVYFTASSKTMFDAVNLDDQKLAGGKKVAPVSSVPLARFDGNIAFAAKSGVEVWFHQTMMTDGSSFIDNFTAWGTRLSGVTLQYVGRTAIRNSLLIGDVNLYSGTGVATNRLTQDLLVENTHIDGYAVGIEAAARRATVIDHGRIKAVQAIRIDKGQDTLRNVLIIAPVYEYLTPLQLRGRRGYEIYMTAAFDPRATVNRNFNSLVSQDMIYVIFRDNARAYLHYPEQAADYVAFPSAAVGDFVPSQYRDKTNAQLRAVDGISLGGALLPSNVRSFPLINGFVQFA
ncbi:MAG TPA: G8 domain-containing protein [Lacipirellulaceae bacterium]|nr:G8 domain-containing protein [Lacipirellulaceae bacterium]